MKAARRALGVFVVLTAIGLLGCGHIVTIVPLANDGTPLAAAHVVVDGTPVGQGTTDVRASEGHNVMVDAGPEWIPETLTVGPETQSPIQVALRPDELYRATVDDANQVVNRWLTLNVSASAREGDVWWSAIVNALTGRDFEMELMDPRSGFVRSAWKESVFGGMKVRRRFVGNTVSPDPLQWRIQYEVQVQNGTDWVEYTRAFREDLDALAEIRSRIE